MLKSDKEDRDLSIKPCGGNVALSLAAVVVAASVLSGIRPASTVVWLTEMFWAWGLVAVAAAAWRWMRFSTSAYAGLAVVAVAVGAFLFLNRNTTKTPSEPKDKKPAKIAEATPSKPAAPAAAKPEMPKPLPPQRIGETRDGKVLLPDGTLHVVKGVITSGVARVSLIDRTFKHDTDCMLAHLLTVEPGEGFVGDSESIYSGFEKEFLKTLDDPIVYDKDDSAYVKELKAGVMAMRQELKDARARGESIERILIDTRDQLQQLGLYRQELEEQVLKMSEDGMTQQDYDDLTAAANRMLEERGSKPLEPPSTVRHAIRLGRLIRDNEAKEGAK